MGQPPVPATQTSLAMTFDNWILDSAFAGKRELTDDQLDAFEAGQYLASWILTAHTIMLLKTHGLEDLATTELDKNVMSFDEASKMIKDSHPDISDRIEFDHRVAEDGYARALKIVKILLTA